MTTAPSITRASPGTWQLCYAPSFHGLGQHRCIGVYRYNNHGTLWWDCEEHGLAFGLRQCEHIKAVQTYERRDENTDHHRLHHVHPGDP